MSATSSTVEIYIDSTLWKEPYDYHRAAYLDFKEIPHKESQKELQMYYVEKGFFTSKIMDKIHPGIKKIEKKNASSAAKSNGNVIFTMKRERVIAGSTSYYMYYIITEDDKHVPISDDPELKELHTQEEITKTKLDNEINANRMKWITDKTQQSSLHESRTTPMVDQVSTKPQTSNFANLQPDDDKVYKVYEVDEVGILPTGVNGLDGGKRKTKQKRSKNKRQTRQTRRYFKR